MPPLKDSDRNTVVSIKAKEALVPRSAFPKSPTNLIESPAISYRLAHTKITKEVVAQEFII